MTHHANDFATPGIVALICHVRTVEIHRAMYSGLLRTSRDWCNREVVLIDDATRLFHDNILNAPESECGALPDDFDWRAHEFDGLDELEEVAVPTTRETGSQLCLCSPPMFFNSLPPLKTLSNVKNC